MAERDAETERLGFVKLEEAPRWVLQYPTCSACLIELETDGDGWECPNCGTQWEMGANDDDQGTLYADYWGEDPTGPVVTEKEAGDWGLYREALDKHRRLGAKYPTLYPKPIRPDERRSRPGGGSDE